MEQDTEGGFITHQIKMHAYLQRTTGLVHLLTHPQTKRDLIVLLRHTVAITSIYKLRLCDCRALLKMNPVVSLSAPLTLTNRKLVF